MPADSIPAFNLLRDVYEPSAIEQLADGRFLVVEDEKEHPFSLVSLRRDGQVTSTALEPGFFEFNGRFWKLDDLEGLTQDRAGWLYAITSHSRDGSGDEKKARDKLVRFRIESGRIVDSTVSTNLKTALCAAYPELAAAAAHHRGQGTRRTEYRSPGLRRQCHRHLLIGLRSPLLGGQALIGRCDNPGELFEAGRLPHFAGELIRLDLAGDGIRGMAYLPSLGGHLLIGGPVDRAATQFRLWCWSGLPGDAARRVEVPGLAGFEHAEGLCPAQIDGRDCIFLVSDDGDRKAKRPAHYLLLDPEQLRIAP
jgi:hypothetical protein